MAIKIYSMIIQTISVREKLKIGKHFQLNLKLILFLVLIFAFSTCPIWGQVVQKKQIMESDYHLWGKLNLDKVASNGKWSSYSMRYEKGADTLFVSNTETSKKFDFPSGKNSLFAGTNHFVCMDDKGALRILNLVTGKQRIYPPVSHYDYSIETNQIVLLSKEEQVLKIINLKTDVTDTINDVQNFKMDPSKKELVFTKMKNLKHSIGLLHLGNSSAINWIVENSSNHFRYFTWHELGKSIAFYTFNLSDSDDTKLYFYNVKDNALQELNPTTQKDFPTDKILDRKMVYPLTISSDGLSVFFGLCPQSEQEQKKTADNVEVWNGNSKWIYPFEKIKSQPNAQATLALWYPHLKRIKSISSPTLPKVMLAGNYDFAILSNPKEYEPQFEYEGPRDFYIMNLKTGETEILLQKHKSFSKYLLPSPSGKYIAYFKDAHWWVYDIAKRTHQNVTKNSNTSFSGKVHILDGTAAYGNVGWSKNDDNLIVYDQYDLWSINSDGTTSKRLTHGREKQITFRIASLADNDLFKSNFDGNKSKTIDLDHELILSAAGADQKTGYFKWNSNFGEKPIVYKDSYIDQMHYIKDQQLYVYQEQQSDLSPRLMFQKKTEIPKPFFESNPQQSKYHWGTSKLISFRNYKGQELKAVLYYPANYDPQKKYPMIVNVYEKQSDKIHFYHNPSLLMQAGYNRTVFTSKDYFVLCPDIEHEQGKAGFNALDCTVSATKEIIKLGLVDPKKIGLIGHSFGGYESAFIITQTNIFATAVAGATATDLTSFYLTVGWDTGRPDMYRFQSEQWRLGKTPFEDPSLYTRNSPIANASSIETPLLLWTGKEDQHVDWHQSVAFHLALRRLGKKNIMLLYPDEKHVILKPNNQKDLSHKIEEWFDYYLKERKDKSWIKEGVK